MVAILGSFKVTKPTLLDCSHFSDAFSKCLLLFHIVWALKFTQQLSPPSPIRRLSCKLFARKPVLTAGLQALASQRLHFLSSSVCDLRTTSPIKPCADTCPSPEVREAPSGPECGVSPALGLQTPVSLLWSPVG